MERNEAFRCQLETQNHLLVQLNQRLDRVFLQLSTMETARPHCRGEGSEFQLRTIANSHPENELGDRVAASTEDFANEAEVRELPIPSRPTAAVSSWQQQRETMLKCLVAQLEIEDSIYPTEHSATEHGHSPALLKGLQASAEPLPARLPHLELQQVEALKDQLHAAIREMEVECSVQRAKLSHERARLEAQESDLARRENKLARESREQATAEERAEPLVSRIKGLLRRSGS